MFIMTIEMLILHVFIFLRWERKSFAANCV